MTDKERQEAIRVIKSECYIFNMLNLDRTTIVNTALDMAVEALKAEPCEDCISRDYVLQRFKGMCELCGEGEKYNGVMCRSCYLDAAIDVVENASPVTPAREKGTWIPVSEGLPEERDWYLAVFKESDTGFQLIPRVADYIGMGENNWQLMDEDGLPLEYRDLLECIAWMPLPEPYKVESEDKA